MAQCRASRRAGRGLTGIQKATRKRGSLPRVEKARLRRSFPPRGVGMFTRKRVNAPPDRQSRSIRIKIRGTAVPSIPPKGFFYSLKRPANAGRFYGVIRVQTADNPHRRCRRTAVLRLLFRTQRHTRWVRKPVSAEKIAKRAFSAALFYSPTAKFICSSITSCALRMPRKSLSSSLAVSKSTWRVLMPA